MRAALFLVPLAACAHGTAQVRYLAPDAAACPSAAEHAEMGLDSTELYASIMAVPVDDHTSDAEIRQVVEDLPLQIQQYRDSVQNHPAGGWTSACTLGQLSAALSHLTAPEDLDEAERRAFDRVLATNLHPLVVDVRADAQHLAANASVADTEWSLRARTLAEQLGQ